MVGLDLEEHVFAKLVQEKVKVKEAIWSAMFGFFVTPLPQKFIFIKILAIALLEFQFWYKNVSTW